MEQPSGSISKREEGVLGGKEDIIELISRSTSTATERLDICADSSWVKIIASTPSLVDACKALLLKRVKMQVITEIVADNIAYCKEIMKFAQLRHKDHVMEGIWAITENDFISTLPQNNEKEPREALQYMHSNVKEVLTLQKFVFNRLWERGTPAEIKIQELESGGAEKTEIFYGAENAIRIIAESMASVEKEMVAYSEAASIDLVRKVEPIRNEYMSLRNRGVNFRSIHEITRENLAYCKELMQYAEIRHLDGIKGNFAVTDKEYLATARLNVGNEPVTEVIRSTSRAIMEQHRYFFESLWSKSIPAEQRVRELEEGVEVPRIEIIEDSRKSIAKATDIIENTQNEFLVSFATLHTFALAVQMGALDSYKRMLERGATVKVLVPKQMGSDDSLIHETMQQTSKVVPSVNVKLTESDLNTWITIMISDRRKFMTWELRDDSNEDPYKAAGVATYCNIESLAASYAKIFESLWDMAEMYEKVKAHNRAQNEFINIVAHELRTPIQPILGLAEVMREHFTGNPEQTVLIDAIIKNATRLQNLQEAILEVARIESNLFHLNMSRLNLQETIKAVVTEVQHSLKTQKAVNVTYDGSDINDVVVYADGDRISQVLRNLLENALKFTSKGTIRVAAQISESRQDVIISVKDTGTGIDQEIMSKLFQKFVTKSSKGTGLGLYICRNVVESHGGKIWAKNNGEQPGATFYFTLPIKTVV